MTASKKHHYVPRFYLEGFTDTNGFFFVYDKWTQKTWRCKPEQAFFENRRNTGKLQFTQEDPPFVSDSLESSFADVDSTAASVINRIKHSNPEDQALTFETLVHLQLFLLSLFWRSPANDSLREDVLQSEMFKSLNFGTFEVVYEDGNKDPESVMHDTDLLKKIYSSFLPHASFREPYLKMDKKNWRLYYGGASHGLIGDNPVIHKPFKDFASLHKEVFFKVSSGITLVSTELYKPDVLSPLFITNVDLLLFQQAKRYVASSEKNYLTSLITLYLLRSQEPGWKESLQQRTFEAFY